MEIDSLAQRLRDPDPRVRVETLRILAMVEETLALDAIRWLYQNDPEAGVREVAGWAGRLIWAAEQRGHSTQKGVEALFALTLTPERQERFLASLTQFDLRHARHRDAVRYAQDQTYRRQLDDVLHDAAAVSPAAPVEGETVSALPPPRPEAPVRRRKAAPPLSDEELAQLDDLLDVGLSDEFWGRAR